MQGTSDAWLDSVESLKRVSEKALEIDPKISYGLIGMAIENVLKALMQYAGHESLIKNKNQWRLSKEFRDHNLDKLAEKIDCFIKFTEEERILLRKLSQFVIWMMRYPIPTVENQMEVKHTSHKEFSMIKDLFSKIYTENFKIEKKTYKVRY